MRRIASFSLPRFPAVVPAAMLVAILASAPAAAAVSPAVGKALNAAASAAKSGNVAAAVSAINSAKAAASSPEEKTKTSQMAAYVYTRAGRYGEAAAALESVGAPPSQIAPLYYQAGNYDRAIAEAKKGGGEGMQILIAQASVKKRRYAEAVAAYNGLIKANGAKPIYLENLAAAQYKAGDKKGYLATTERLVRVDNSPARWKTLLTELGQSSMRPEAKLALYHLMSATGTIDRPVDYQEFAKLALVANQAGIAKDALAKAGAAGTDAMSQRMAQAASNLAAKAATDAPKLAAAPGTALRGGNAYLGLGQYPQAIAAYDKVIAAKGSDADQALVYKGIAAIKAGNNSVAKQSFAAVSATGGMKDVAQLWALYASTHG